MIKYKIYQENERWFGYRKCPECKNEIKQSSLKRGILLRNIRNLNNISAICSSCNKKGNKNHFFGKKHTNESNKKISKNRKGKACGEDNAMSNPIHRQSVSEALKEKYKSGDLDSLKEKQRETMTKSFIEGKLKTTPISNAEKEIKKTLEKMGFLIEAQFLIGKLKYDLLLKQHNVIIEYNGDYWHCNPIKYKDNYLNKKKNKFAYELWEYDKQKKELAEKNGYKLFTIWETDYMFNKEEEIKKIINNL